VLDAAFSESDLALALDDATRSTKSLPALLTDWLYRAVRLVELRFGEDTIAAATAPQLCGVRLLIRKGASVHGSKLGREQLGVSASNAEHNERTGIPDHGGTYCLRELVSVLV
jgi:hypothetical protein